MRYLLTITYDGENFYGWQKQKNRRTIQDEIEKSILIITKEKVEVVGSGRTDAKVNALNQKAHFELSTLVENVDKFVYSMNGILPNDITILKMEETDIHARFSAKNKTYMYQMYKSQYNLPLKKNSLKINLDTDIEAMQECTKILIGEHDFANFCCSGSTVESTVRTIFNAKFEINNDDVKFYICGNGFLYKMVRNIVGLLLEVGKRKIDKQKFADLAFNVPHKNHKTAPAEALFLYDVEYK